MMDSTPTTIVVPADVPMAALTGPADAFLQQIQAAFKARITVQGNEVRIVGSEEEREAIVTIFADLMDAVRADEEVNDASISRLLDMMLGEGRSPQALRSDVLLTYRGRAIRPKTLGQKAYVDAVRNNLITFSLGPAGTGKTFLAMAMAVASLERKEVSRIILSRPIVEAGESLGFLPGTLTEKVDPYIRPLYDALFDMMDAERAHGLIERNVIEIAPLAFMRGRTLSDSFIILDEAQNATPEQVKMALTRLGSASRMVITADESQSDLPQGPVGIRQAQRILQGIEGLAFIELDGKDVIRNSLVSKIIAAYQATEGR